MKRRDDLSKLNVERAMEAVNAGEKDEAMKCIKQLWEEARSVQSLTCEIISSLLTFMAEKFGEETIVEA